ncbi:MAG TPA: alpha-hydroxy acid oxidase [Terriglobia bacterium]|jgi:isopentenyl diphosphate isomerase/L-lactate dehydrogenase-like FMN-dependent dehydrogenase
MSASDRRSFLKFLAASPLFASALASLPAFAQTLDQASDALDVFDFQAAAQKAIPPAHWGYLMTGVDGEETLKANRDGYAHYQLKTRRFVDVSKMDMSVELFGMKFNSPIVLCPVGSQRAFHRDGEVGAARAAQAKGHLQILSTQTSIAVEDVIKARGGPIWYQLYTTDNFDATTKLVKRAEAAGCTAVAVTVDLPAGRNTETMSRLQRTDTRVCGTCHDDATGTLANPRVGGGTSASKPMFAGINTQGLGLTSPSLTWDFIKRLKDVTKMKVVIKGLETREDASQAIEHGADGIIVSNHGGRATETGRGTIECLPEVVQAVRGRIPVIVDGGVRRGTDVFKALAVGATAVGIGRPYIWGLGAFGQQGVERVLDILNNELRLAMAGCGTRTVKEITSASLIEVRRG